MEKDILQNIECRKPKNNNLPKPNRMTHNGTLTSLSPVCFKHAPASFKLSPLCEALFDKPVQTLQ